MKMKNGKRIATDNDPRLYPAEPRGIGSNWGSCMICGGDKNKLRNDCAFLVPSRETGEAIVNLFEKGARLDYRHFEPHWIQIKITACDEHKDKLEQLVLDVNASAERLDGPGISKEMVDKYTKNPY